MRNLLHQWVGAMAVLLCASPLQADSPRPLTLDARIACQEAIDRVYYAHRLKNTGPFEVSVPRAHLGDKVRTHLRQSLALERIWSRPITGEMLYREWERILDSTLFPDRLDQVYNALDRDPFLFQECFVRPVLVNRLVRSFHRSDPRLHAEARERAEAIRRDLDGGAIDPAADHPLRSVDRRQLVNPDDRPAGPDANVLLASEFERWRGDSPRTVGEVGPVMEERTGFTVRVVLDDGPGATDVAVYRVPKETWDAWWQRVREDLDPLDATAVADDVAPRPRPESSPSSCLPDDTWDNGILDDWPGGMDDHGAVWTGSLMLVFGRLGGWRYDPLTDLWTPASAVGEPTPRSLHTAVWTGSEMIVWGGVKRPSNAGLDDAGRYNPTTDTWQPVSTVDAPTPRFGHIAVWTGAEMIVWGGEERVDTFSYVSDGSRYNPATDTWTPMAMLPALPANARFAHSAVWTGSEVLIWGGRNSTGLLGHGIRYNPATDIWGDILVSANSPEARSDHTAIWTGPEMIIWGGSGLASGGRFNPTTRTWTPTSTVQAPSGRSGHTTVWTGARMIVWGGGSGLNTGAEYNPFDDSWIATPTTDAPLPRHSHTAVWTGSEMIVWGGSQTGGTGGRYDPGAGTWTPTSTGSGPGAFYSREVVWSGSELIVWGEALVEPRMQGGRYDPLADAWTPMTTVDAPTEPGITFWTGTEMLTLAGGLYDPFLDQWTPIDTSGGPSLINKTAVWTGSEVILWGYTSPGGRYDPVTQLWSPVSTVGEPAVRWDHGAVWTGTEMMVWAGRESLFYVTDGGRYDPSTDTWTPTSVVGAPSPRTFPLMVWTGDEVIVWNGWGFEQTGARYDPIADAWTPMTTVNAPDRRFYTDVWTGKELIAWRSSGGARYEPLTDTWTPMSPIGAPRLSGAGVWTGGFMITVLSSTGGRYALNQSADLDSDGVPYCAGDCDDFDPASFPGAPEVCDTADNNCDGVVDEGFDADGDGFTICALPEPDCDDGDPTSFPLNPEICDNRDNDCDGIVDTVGTACGVGECAGLGTCVAGIDDCTPGAPGPEVCDGLDNDCDGAVPPGEADGDGDGVRLCAGDCDDANASTYPGAAEVNDGLDNQCVGDPGFGLVDELTGGVTLSSGGPPQICWTAQGGATGYELLHASDPTLGSCTLEAVAGTCAGLPAGLAVGEVELLLVRPSGPFAGSWGADGSGADRAVACESGSACGNGLDDDNDGRIDCADWSDCYGTTACPAAELSFVDTFADDLPTTGIQDFLAELPLGPADHVLFSLEGSTGTVFELCLAEADFYQTQYLSLAPTSGTAISGAWNKWYRAGSGGWVGPDTTAFENRFGDDCTAPFSWCPEFGLGGHIPGVSPELAVSCEAFDDATCSDGTWVFTLRIGVDRLAACGF